MKKAILLSVSFFVLHIMQAQKEELRDHTIGYHHIFYSGISISNHGWGINFRRGYHRTVKKKFLYEVEFSTLRHPREVKQTNDELQGNFVYGKLNYAYNLRLGIGQHNILAYKPLGGGVEIKTILSYGLVSGILKPAYYLIIYPDQLEASEEKFDPEEHNLYQIIGPGSYFKGFNELSLVPGIFGKFALNFEYAAEKTSIKALETGIVVDGYYKSLEIMAFEKNYPVYLSFYLSLQFGRKWYR